MTTPTLGMVHVDVPLTNMSVAYMQDATNHFGRSLFPNVAVNKKSGKFFKFDKAAFLSRRAKKRAPGTRAARGGYTTTTASFDCEEYSFGHALPDEIRANFDSPLSADRAAVAVVSESLLLEEDYLAASTFFATGIWGTERAGVASGPTGTQFLRWDAANSDPIGDMRAAIRELQKLIGRRPNLLGLSPSVWDTLVDHTDLVGRLSTSSLQVVTEDLLGTLLGLPPGAVRVLEAVYNSAKEGQTASMSHIVGKHAMLAYVSNGPSLDEPTAGATFHWSEFDGVAANGAVAVRRYREEAERQDVYEGSSYLDMEVVCSDAGYFFKDAVS